MKLPEPIEIFISSENAHDADAVAACFAADAFVVDEGRTMTGLEAIAAWRRQTAEKYRHTVEPLEISERDGETVIACKLSGNFPGSPIKLNFVFALRDGKIASLRIGS
jgi:ketosteroid isomerase-like protein